jgi:hypothetical protein
MGRGVGGIPSVATIRFGSSGNSAHPAMVPTPGGLGRNVHRTAEMAGIEPLGDAAVEHGGSRGNNSCWRSLVSAGGFARQLCGAAAIERDDATTQRPAQVLRAGPLLVVERD